MAVQIRSKGATRRLDDLAIARLRGEAISQYSSYCGSSTSGSEHGSDTCLSRLVNAFLESHSPAGSKIVPDTGEDDDNEDDADLRGSEIGSYNDTVETIRELLDPPAESDPFRIRLIAEVASSVEAEVALLPTKPAFRRAVMARLRAAGYDAGLCKAKWESRGGVAGGSYEYIDVVAGSDGRYIVDTDFRAGMEVARATEHYSRILAAIPEPAVVAKPEAVARAVRMTADAARRSMKSQGLHVPPWRKSRYMLAKWLGPYRRTTNPLSGSCGSGVMLSVMGTRGSAKVDNVVCRAVGFDQVGDGRGWRVAPAANIR